ncbi:MAG: putative LPS assembly protein LptD [candidate division KSB1 bacterium]|nr:putative LPS assembly protein LptD [candidate division KSB1 bacterium]MDZ7412225.1 putative LPS assembly protein LptD [candidate division KSB1 bacterium]
MDNLVEERITYLLGDALVRYRTMTLRAEKITVEWDKNLLTAEGVPDTVLVPSANPGDSVRVVRWRGLPTLISDGETMTGFKMVYNTATDKGIVVRGRTEFEGGFYGGQQIKRVGGNVYNVSHGEFTTCDLTDDAHYHFYCRRMKMIPNDKVVAQGLVMYLGRIPVLGFPFAVFPHRKGRQSGFLMPRYGYSAREGNYLRGLGYYWAPNDYFDAQGTVDYFERSGLFFQAGMNYAVRYVMRGWVNGSITRKDFTYGIRQRRWDLQVQHAHEIDPTLRISAAGYFVSDGSFYRDLSTNLDARLTRQLRSNATLSKTWRNGKVGLTVNASHVRDLQTDETTLSLPQASLYVAQGQFFPPATTGRGRMETRRGVKEELRWYQAIYYSYSSNLMNTEVTRKWQGVETKTVNRRLAHNIGLSMNNPGKLFGWLGLSQSLSINEDWFDRTTDYFLIDSTNSIGTRERRGFAARHVFSYSLSGHTKLYGLFTPNVFGVKAVRHVVTPTLSFSYQPDFSQAKWGYYEEVVDTTGRVYRRDRFGGTPAGGQQRLSLRVNNVFQMKTGDGEKERKFDLFTADLSTGFNFRAKEFKLSDLYTTLSANPLRNLSISASATHSFYRYDPQQRRVVNDYLFDQGGLVRGKLAWLTGFRFNASVRLEGKAGRRAAPPTPERGPEEALEQELPPPRGVFDEEMRMRGDRFEGITTFTGLDIPWSVSFSLGYDMDRRSDPAHPRTRYYLDVRGLQVQVTKKWRVEYSAHFDLKEKEVASHRWVFYRDLHCWEAMFDWVPSGIAKRFYLRIQVKAPQLRDLKLEARGGRASVFGY